MRNDLVFVSLLLPTPINVDVDDDGRTWVFNYAAELLILNDENAEQAAEALDALAKKLGAQWCRVNPYPHYRLSVSRFLDAVKEVRKLTEEDAHGVRQSWQT